ncbi:MAG: GWxTD domain-containing protein [Bacteroidetes bacterium]|nr:GWxTD domain-containing protein [Bacteroidota bacterium]
MRLRLLVLLATLTLPSALHASTIEFVADFMQFRIDSVTTRWEMHYAYPDTAVAYVKDPKGGYLGELYLRVEITTALRDTIVQDWIASSSSATSRFAHKQYYMGVRLFELKHGQYKVRIIGRDLHDSTRNFEKTGSIVIKGVGTAPAVSDIMFTQPLRSVGLEDPRFNRNGVQTIPNPRHECIGTDPSIPIYAEVYNMKRNGIDTFAIEYKVVDAVMHEVMTSYVQRVGTADGLVERVDVPAGVLPSGVYRLQMSLMDKERSKTYASSTKQFYILNPEQAPQAQAMLSEDEMFLQSEWSTVTGKQLALELELSDILAVPAERTTLAGCTTERAKQKYLFRFWRLRDPEPSTPGNERLDQFRKDFQRAQTYYTSAMFKDGWRSDRGRIILRYGYPTQIEQFVQTIDTRPYETWFYQNLMGGSYFYFVDTSGLGNHKLVHSTLLGEIRDEKWFDNYARVTNQNPDTTRELTQPVSR